MLPLSLHYFCCAANDLLKILFLAQAAHMRPVTHETDKTERGTVQPELQMAIICQWNILRKGLKGQGMCEDVSIPCYLPKS